MRKMIREHRWWFLAGTLLALALRLLFVYEFPHFEGDSLIYGDLAKNLLLHGTYGLSTAHGLLPTYIRLPGYPLFLALVFSLFGMEHYHAVLMTQMAVDIGTCFVIAELAREIASEKAGAMAFLMAAVCPFTANFISAALSETLAIFFAALSFLLGVKAIAATKLEEATAPGPVWTAHSARMWAACGAAIGASILIRPDGGMLLMVLGGWLLLRWPRSPRKKLIFASGVLLAITSLGPLVPWTLRNWVTMRQFEPLAPRYANDPGEFVSVGFFRWERTWAVDFISVIDIGWRVPDEPIAIERLPSRAFDTPEQRKRTGELFDAYNDEGYDVSPEIDAKFNSLAEERIRAAPLRYYAWLPALRMADLWLRPRTELLDIEPDWWNYDAHEGESQIAVGLAVWNLAYILLALGALVRNRDGRFLRLTGVLVVYVVFRTVFLSTLENPEPRYMLEAFPVVLALAGAALTRRNPAASAGG